MYKRQNLYLEESAPNEQNFFFRYVQLARNRNNAAIYGGSNTVLSRKALMDAGGFYTGSITEDLATGLLIQAAGYKGYAVSEVHASGLSPEDLTSLFKQRERWARGCIPVSYTHLDVYKRQTHDLGVIADVANHVAVMYLGRIVEMGTREQIFKNPLHPYTCLLYTSRCV